MARPVRKYDAQSYGVQIETLGRLRTSTVLNTDVDERLRNATVEAIDKLIECLMTLRKACDQTTG